MREARPPLVLFPAQNRPRSRPVVFQCKSPGQQGLLGDVIVRLCVAVFCAGMSMCSLAYLTSALWDVTAAPSFAVVLWEAPSPHPGPQRSGSSLPVRYTAEAVVRSHWALLSVTPHCKISNCSVYDLPHETPFFARSISSILQAVFYSILRTEDFICVDM